VHRRGVDSRKMLGGEGVLTVGKEKWCDGCCGPVVKDSSNDNFSFADSLFGVN
jgi:hypothetical protein